MANSILDRIKSIIFYPSYQWKIIAAEKRTLKEDFNNYALTIILIGAAAQALGSFFFVRNVLDIDAYRFSFPIVQAVFYIIIQTLTVFILTFFVFGMSKKFQSQKNFANSGKLVIYSLTPLFLCNIIVNLDHRLVFLLIPAFYGLYIFAKGLPLMLKTNLHKIPAFLFIIAISALGILYLLGNVFELLTRLIFSDITVV